MKFVNQSAPVAPKKLAVGSLVIETNGERLSPDSVTGLKVDDYHVLSLGSLLPNEPKLVKIEDGVDKHFKTAVAPSQVSISVEQSVIDIINKAMETSTYVDHGLDFPDTDDDLYEQVKDSVPMPIDKGDNILDQLVAIVSDFSVTKYGRLAKLAKLRDVADTPDVAELIDEAIKDLEGKHLSAAAIADKYKALANDLQANYSGDDSDDDESVAKRAIRSAEETIANAVSSSNTPKVSETLSKLAEEAKTIKLDTKDLDNDDYLKFLDKYFSELKNNKLSNSEIIAYLDKLQLDDEYLRIGISNLKDKIKEGTEDAGKILDSAIDELNSQFQLRLGLNKLMSLLGYEEDDDSEDDGDDDDDLTDLFDDIFDSYYKEGAPSDREAKLLVQVLKTIGHIADGDLYKFTKKFMYKLTEGDYKDNAEKVMAALAEEYEQKF